MSDPIPNSSVTADPTLDRLRRIAMIITAARLAAAPLIAWLILTAHPTLAFWLLLLAGIGALLEGAAALMFKTRTALGSVLDALADRLLPALALLALALIAAAPWWAVLPLLAREGILAVGSDLPRTLGKGPWLPEPRWAGHIIGVLQGLLALLVLAVIGPGIGFDFYIGPVALIVTLLAMASLIVAFLRRRRDGDRDALA